MPEVTCPLSVFVSCSCQIVCFCAVQVNGTMLETCIPKMDPACTLDDNDTSVVYGMWLLFVSVWGCLLFCQIECCDNWPIVQVPHALPRAPSRTLPGLHPSHAYVLSLSYYHNHRPFPSDSSVSWWHLPPCLLPSEGFVATALRCLLMSATTSERRLNLLDRKTICTVLHSTCSAASKRYIVVSRS
jgi:hypothetical protein